VRGAGPVEDALVRLGVQTHRIAYPCRLRRGPMPWYEFSAARAIGRLVTRLAPAVIHANNFFGLLYAGRAARRQGIPLVWTCHGPFDMDRWVKRRVARAYATHVACVSEAVRREVARWMPEPGRASTDYLGIRPFETPGGDAALRPAIRREFQVDDATPLIAVVGRFQPIKGHGLLLEALPAVWRRFPGLVVCFIGDALFGSAEEAAEKARIERRIRAEGWGGRVRLLGFRPDARRLLRALDALVIPSRYESFGMAALEGLEAGLPVAGPNAGGPREIMDVPATGLLFEPGDADDLACKIVALLAREGDGARFDPAAGPRRVAERFSVQAHWARTWALYQKLAPEALAPKGARNGGSPAEPPAEPPG